jgi:hypothetical protein
MSQVLSGELDMLQNRIQSPIVPAIQDLEYKPVERENGRMGYVITGGKETWSHKSVEICQREIDDFGLIAFLRECQHEVGIGGRFFPQFREYGPNGEEWHVVDSVTPEPWWRFWASHDFGTNSPCAFLLYCSDDKENIYVIGEFYEPGHVSSSQADKALALLEKHKLGEPADKRFRDGKWNTKLEAIAFDWANTFPPENPEQRIGEYPVEIWWRKNLPAVRAVKDRKAGWRRVQEWLNSSRMETVGDKRYPKPRIQIVRNACPNLIKELEKAMADPKDPEDLDSGTKLDHALDSFRYGLMWREYPVTCPETEKPKVWKPLWSKDAEREEWL